MFKPEFKKASELQWKDSGLLTEDHINSLLPSKAVGSGRFGNTHKSNADVITAWADNRNHTEETLMVGTLAGTVSIIPGPDTVMFVAATCKRSEEDREKRLLKYDYVMVNVPHKGVNRQQFIKWLQEAEEKTEAALRMRVYFAVQNFVRCLPLVKMNELRHKIWERDKVIRNYREAYLRKDKQLHEAQATSDYAFHLYNHHVKENWLRLMGWRRTEKKYAQLYNRVRWYAIMAILVILLISGLIIAAPAFVHK
jgi:hypothetical protein